MKKYLFVTIFLMVGIVVYADITLNDAVKIAKTYFDIPSNFTNFSFNYNTYDHTGEWNLSWSSPQINDLSNGSLSITINASNGEIESMYCWNQSENQPKYAFPRISREQARETALSFLKKIIPGKINQLIRVNNSDQIVPLNLPQSYSFEWERSVNGILFPANYVEVSVDAQSGMVNRYQIKWSDQEFRYPSDIITPEQAKQAFFLNDLLKLEYYPVQNTHQSTAILVYSLFSSGAIDAVTGKPLQIEKGQWIDFGYFSNVINDQGKIAEKPHIVETEFMNRKMAVEDLKKIISIPPNLELTSANLSYNSYDSRLVWNLYWGQIKSKSGTITSIFAGIDAKNGSLDHLYVNYQGGDVKKPLGEDEAQKLAESFLKKAQPKYFEQIKLNPDSGYKPEGAYNFVYDRIVNGIPFPANTIQITVNDAGIVTSYGSNWSNTSFESTSQIIPLDRAKKIFLNYRPLVLYYVKINDQNNSTSTIKLVYLPEIKNPTVSNFLNAKTGEPVGWNGMPINNIGAYHFKDLNSTEYATYISYLGQAGLFGEYGDLFMPSKKIKVIDFLKNLLAIRDGIQYINSLSGSQIMDMAMYDDLVWRNVPNEYMTKDILSEIIIRFLGLKIAGRVYGYKNFAERLGILSGHSDITRLDAAVSIIKAIELEEE
ncbi:YcdB/YcdC domain-containing protein [Athalassotoga sp.]|uniref:YcdB/YcdC domain-containing protein n=1 Tax=Athalassotoga sp. TaxID=2022597 RepID=UPI003D044D68